MKTKSPGSPLYVKLGHTPAQLFYSLTKDPDLSPTARHLLWYLLTRSQPWTLRIKDLQTQLGVGERAVYKALGKLRALGYLRRVKPWADGHYQSVEYYVHSSPQLGKNDEIATGSRNPASATSLPVRDVEKSTSKKEEEAFSGESLRSSPEKTTADQERADAGSGGAKISDGDGGERQAAPASGSSSDQQNTRAEIASWLGRLPNPLSTEQINQLVSRIIDYPCPVGLLTLTWQDVSNDDSVRSKIAVFLDRLAKSTVEQWDQAWAGLYRTPAEAQAREAALEDNGRVLSMGFLREDEDGGFARLLNDVKYRDRDFVLVDESHNFRYPDTQRYKVLQTFLSTGRRSCFLTATPRNKSALDVYHQIKLFHQDDRTDLPIDPPNLKEYFKLIEKGERNLPGLLANILIRRTRNHILRWYGFDAETHEPVDTSRFQEYAEGKRKAYVLVGGRHQFFPKRELETIEYSIEDTYQGLYQELRGYLGKPRRGKLAKAPAGELSYARYGLWHYVNAAKQKNEPYVNLQRAGANLRGLMRVLLFKRFESSVYAFRETVKRLLSTHKAFLAALNEDFVPAGEEAQSILYESDSQEERDIVDALRQVSTRYDAKDFDLKKLREHIEHDIDLLGKILNLVLPITPDKDAKLQTLKKRLADKPLAGAKRLIFTQYADTARYLFENLNPNGEDPEIEVIFSGEKSKERVVGRFAPKANPEYRFGRTETELMTVIATDVLAEGLNLQDCDNIVNYDLHWNPVRLIQRFGRIDRIGSEHEVIWGYNFLPETGIEANLKLHERLEQRIQEIHDTIGEDSEILDRTERLNSEAMYAIYETRGGGPVQLDLWGTAEDEFLDLNEAEEILRLLRKENPAEYERIANLRDGIRTGRHSLERGMFVFCQAGRYQQLFLLDEKGEVVSRDIPKVLGTVKCSPDTEAAPLPGGYNQAVMSVQRTFAEEVKHREAEKTYTLTLSHGQRYVLRELRILFEATEEEDVKRNVNVLEKVFRGSVTGAVKGELNQFRRHGVTGENLLKSLIRVYDQHNLKDVSARRSLEPEDRPIPRIICSEAFV